jgi:hypothetical protein
MFSGKIVGESGMFFPPERAIRLTRLSQIKMVRRVFPWESMREQTSSVALARSKLVKSADDRRENRLGQELQRMCETAWSISESAMLTFPSPCKSSWSFTAKIYCTEKSSMCPKVAAKASNSSWSKLNGSRSPSSYLSNTSEAYHNLEANMVRCRKIPN